MDDETIEVSPVEVDPSDPISPTPEPGPRPFERAIFEALSFEAEQVQKVEVNIGRRSQTVTFKFALTGPQIKQLDEMASRQG